MIEIRDDIKVLQILVALLSRFDLFAIRLKFLSFGIILHGVDDNSEQIKNLAKRGKHDEIFPFIVYVDIAEHLVDLVGERNLLIQIIVAGQASYQLRPIIILVGAKAAPLPKHVVDPGGKPVEPKLPTHRKFRKLI